MSEMLAIQVETSTSSGTIACLRDSRVEMGDNVNGFYYRASHIRKIT